MTTYKEKIKSLTANQKMLLIANLKKIYASTDLLAVDKQLVAYIVAEEEPIENYTIRNFLENYLPSYMIPSAFVFLENLPLTPSGKINRKALPAFDEANLEKENFVAPRTEIEKILATLWQDVLGLEQVGIYDNFFVLGGHSLSAMQLIALIKKAFKQSLSPTLLFQHPTIAQLAIKLNQTQPYQTATPLVTIQAGHKQQFPFFYVPGADPSLFYLYKLAQYLNPKQPFYALQPPGFDGETKPLNSVEALATYFINTIQQVQPTGPYTIGGYSTGAATALEIGLHLQKQGQVVNLVVFDAFPYDPFNHTPSEQWQEMGGIKGYIAMFEPRWGPKTSFSIANLASLSEEALLNKANELFKLAGLLPPEADLEMVKRLGHIYQASVTPLTGYKPQEIFHGSLTLFKATDNNKATDNKMLDNKNNAKPNKSTTYPDIAKLWQDICSKPITIYPASGGHIGMMVEPYLQTWISQLRTCLEQFTKNH